MERIKELGRELAEKRVQIRKRIAMANIAMIVVILSNVSWFIISTMNSDPSHASQIISSLYISFIPTMVALISWVAATKLFRVQLRRAMISNHEGNI